MKELRYIHTRKCAGSSIKGFFKQRGIDIKYGDGYLWDMDEKPFTETVFSVVRNPYTRVLSGYNHMMNWGIPWKKYHERQRTQLGKVEGWYLEYDHVKWPKDNLLDFVEKYDSIDEVWRHVTATQSSFLNGRVDYLMRFETLQEDWKKFCDFIEMPYFPLPHLNNHDEWKKTYFTDEEIAWVQDTFRDDFKNFGYDINVIPRTN